LTTLTRFDPMLNHPTQPSVSPTADVVAFVASGHVYTMNLDGTGLRQLTDGDQTEAFPDWSSDGSTLAAWQALHLITMSSTGANPTRTDVTFADTLYSFNTSQQFTLR
jgi:Tol biopolymer transport system component